MKRSGPGEILAAIRDSNAAVLKSHRSLLERVAGPALSTVAERAAILVRCKLAGIVVLDDARVEELARNAAAAVLAELDEETTSGDPT